MNIFDIIKNLTTNKSAKWIYEVDDKDIVPYVIQRWLAMSSQFRREVRWLDRYVFHLSPKMYITLAWSVLPKLDKSPFIRYISKAKEENELDFLLSKIREHYKLSDNDYNSVKADLLIDIKKNMAQWFAYYGIKKTYWDKYRLHYDQMKTLGTKRVIIEKPKGLAAWGI